jgi:hypothetical protein
VGSDDWAKSVAVKANTRTAPLIHFELGCI